MRTSGLSFTTNNSFLTSQWICAHSLCMILRPGLFGNEVANVLGGGLVPGFFFELFIFLPALIIENYFFLPQPSFNYNENII